MEKDQGLYMNHFLFNVFQPTQQCADWCITEQVIHSNNLEVGAVAFVAFSYVMHLLYFSANEYEKLKRFQTFFLYLSKMSLIIFFAVYILVFRYGIRW